MGKPFDDQIDYQLFSQKLVSSLIFQEKEDTQVCIMLDSDEFGYPFSPIVPNTPANFWVDGGTVIYASLEKLVDYLTQQHLGMCRNQNLFDVYRSTGPTLPPIVTKNEKCIW
jgi:hypothetical protein